jgi:AmiR/NasT family two-component response regulator
MHYRVAGIAVSRDEAMELIIAEKPDLVLMDITIKGKTDGINTAIEVKEKYHLPVIFITAHSDEATIERAKLSDSYGYLVKPLKDTEFKIALENALYKYQTRTGGKGLEEKLKLLLDHLPEAILAADAEGLLFFMNQTAVNLLELSDEDIGQPIGTVFQKTEEKTEEKAYSENTPQKSLEKKHVPVLLQTKNGGSLPVIYSVIRLTDSNFRPEGIMILFQPK